MRAKSKVESWIITLSIFFFLINITEVFKETYRTYAPDNSYILSHPHLPKGSRAAHAGEFNFDMFPQNQALVLRDVKAASFRWIAPEFLAYASEDGTYFLIDLKKSSISKIDEKKFSQDYRGNVMPENEKEEILSFLKRPVLSSPQTIHLVKNGVLFSHSAGVIISGIGVNGTSYTENGLYIVTATEYIEIIYGEVHSLSVSPDGCHAAFIWDRESGREAIPIVRHKYKIATVHFCS